MSQPPDQESVRNRLGALVTYVGLAVQIGPPDILAAALQQMSESDRARVRQQLDGRPPQMQEQLTAAGVWNFFTPAEQRYVSTPPDRVPLEDWSTAAFHLEGVGVLLWALGALPTIPSYSEHAQPDLIAGLNERFPTDTALRSSEEVERARTIAELWHWRARARLFASGALATPPGVSREAFEEHVALTAERAAEDGVISHVLGGDFPIGDRPYASLTAQEVTRLAAIAYGRHWALNWLCGRAPSNRWEDTPTGT